MTRAQRIPGRFESLSVEDGLSQSSVFCILQDSRGFMWFGTESGLNRYDGYDFLTLSYAPDDSASISNNLIHDIKMDGRGRMWIATAAGLNVYNTENGRLKRFFFKEKTSNFKKIFIDENDKIWLVTARGLNYFDSSQGSFLLYPILSERQTLKINDLNADESGNILLATDKGLFSFNKETKKTAPFLPLKSTFFSPVQKICKGQSGVLWLAAQKGLLRYSPASGQTDLIKYKQEAENKKLQANFVYQDSEGLVWIGFDGSGLNCYDPATNEMTSYRQYATQKSGLSSNYFKSVFEDEGGVLWFGTVDAGVIKLVKNNNGFVHYKINPGKGHNPNHDVVYSFAEDDNGGVWVGTMGGLVRFDMQKERFIPISGPGRHRDANTEVFALCIGHSGKLWTGTNGRGLCYFDKTAGSLKKYRGTINNLLDGKDLGIYKIVEDENHFLWICTSGGLFYLNPQNGDFKHYRHDPVDPHGIGDNFVRDLYIDKDKNVWIGTMGGGLSRYIPQQDRFQRYVNDPQDAHSLSNNQVTSIIQDSSGYLFIGTNGGGLNRFDPQTGLFTHTIKRNALSGAVIYAMLKQNNKYLWVSSGRGLYKFILHTSRVNYYDVYDGLQSYEFNAGSALRLHSGALLFGGINGFNLVHPERIRKNSHIPSVQITDFKIFDQSYGLKRLDKFVPLERRLKQKNKIILPYSQNSFTIDFCALDFEAPHMNIYVYHLLNLEKKWYFSRKSRSATFTNIPPGQYIFEVKGANNDLTWNTRATRFEIIIEPPFWATLWFRALTVLAVIFGIYYLYRLRIRNIKKKNEALAAMNATLNREIKERKQAQQALNESERRLSTLIKNLPGIAYRCQNDKHRTMEFVSEGILAVTGYRPESFLQEPKKSFAELIHADDRESILLEIEEKIFRKAPFQIIYRIISSTRQIKWMWEQGRGIYNDQGRLIAIEGFIIDISERKQLEEQLVQAQKMEAVGHLAGGIAHDFNNLLTIIRGYSELSMAMTDQEMPVYKKIYEINKAVDRAEALTQQLLAFSRKQVLKPVPVSLNNQIKETEKMLRRLIGEHIQLHLQLEAGPDTIKADPGKIEQIILNLSINARDAMAKGGKLTIATSNIILDDDFSGFRPELKSGRYVMLTISDSGTGMDEETKEHIFDPFFTTKGSGKGTGLGLATVYGIVKQSRGHITVTSQPGAGTTFMIYFPVIRDEIIISKDAGRLKSDLKGNETILLVEDKKEVRQVILESLESFGYHILQAEDGKQAIEVFRKEKDKISLLLTDVIMPGMNGRDLALKLLASMPSLKVIYMSGYTDDTLGEDGNLEPGMHFIQKPFTTLLLARKIREVLS